MCSCFISKKSNTTHEHPGRFDLATFTTKAFMAKAAISAHQNKAKEKKNAELKLPFIGIGIFGENIMLF